MQNHMYNFEAAFLILVAIAGFAIGSYFYADASQKLSDHKKSREAYVKNNCKVIGFYGKYGEHKTYDCDGRILRESDI